jgi:uncharacterized protein (TIGR02996 family)
MSIFEPYFRALPGCEGLLRAIAAEPDDDTHRLVLADWLDEHGEPERAEFIRLQCRLAEIPDWLAWMLPEEPLRRALQLQVAHRKRWVKGLTWAGFARGMAEEIRLTGSRDNWLGLLTLARKKQPIRRVRADLRPEDWDAFAGEVLGSLRLGELELNLQGPLGADQVTALVNAPHFAALRGLALTYWPMDVAAARVLAEATAPELRDLSLKCGLGDEGISVFARARGFPRLRQLCLAYNGIGGEGAIALATQPTCEGVTHLDLSHNHLGDTGLAALLSSPWLGRVRSLCLRQNGLGTEGVAVLARSPLLANLNHLSLRDNAVGDGAAVLCRSPRSAELECLDLTSTAITSESVQHLAGPPAWTRLGTLLLDHNDINDAALPALTTGLVHIGWLGLTGNWIGPAGMSALTKSANLGGLKRLDLGENPLGAEGAKVIARCAALGELTHLDLHACGIRVEGMLALAESPYLNKLTTLNLMYNRASKAARAAVRGRFPGSGA